MSGANVRAIRPACSRTWGALAALLLAAGTLAMFGSRPAHAEGSRELLANGGDRALTEWRTSLYGNALRRRTFLKVYANAGETINLGSSAAGVSAGDIVVWNPGLVTTYAQSQSLSLPTPSLSCRTAQAANGKLTTRAQELAGPLPASGGYTPCTYTAPSTGTYWVAFYGPSGGSSDVAGVAGTTAVPVVNATQNSGVSAFDITVRNGANTTTYGGRVYTDYLVQQTGGNGSANRIYSTLYAVTKDGFKYQVDMRGLDPNAYVLYGNTVGFLNPDGITPLYHDLYDGSNDSLTAPRGGVTLSPPTGYLFFNPPDTTLPASVVPTPLLPSVSSITFTGSAGGSNGAFGIGGNFVYVGNVGGVSEVVITPYPTSGDCSAVSFDPNLSTNRVLRAALPGGTQNLPWDGKDNTGTNMPISYPGNSGPGFCFRATLHAGEYHFPLLDAENSMLGGPTITLLNPPGGTCPLATCRTAFFDDRGYKTTNGTTVGTVGSVLPGSNPPPSPYYSTAGFDTASTTIRKYGNDGSTGFGDKKGLDLWTYFPSPNVVERLYVVPQNASDLAISKIHSGDFAIGVDNTYTITVRNVGTASISGTITVTDAVPASLPVQSVSGASPWSCATSGQNVTCTASTTLAAGAALPDVTLTVRPVAPPPTTVTNTATVSISGATDTNLANDTSSSPTTITSADLGVTKSASPASPVEGATVTYTVAVKNNGPSTADDVSVADAVPSGLTFVSAVPSQGAWESGTWTVGTLLNGASATLTLSATVNPGQSGQTINNTATVSGGPFDYAAGNNSAVATLTVPATVLTGIVTDQTGSPLSGATVQVTDSLGHAYTVTTGADGRYTVTGSPLTPLAAGPATVTASLAGYVPTTATPTVVAGATATQPLSLSPVSLGGVVTDLGTGVPVVGATVTLTQGSVTCTATTGAGGTYFFEHTSTCPIVAGAATVTASATKYQDASASPTILSTGPTTQDLAMGTVDLLITKTDGETSVRPGQSLTYVITIRNNGSIDAAGLVVSDTPGADLSYVSDTGVASGLTIGAPFPDAGVYRWTLASLAKGASVSFSVVLQVSSALPDGTTSLSNYVKVTTTTAEKDTTNNEVSDVDTVTAHPDLTIAKTFTSSPPAGTGSTVTYRLTGGNVGHATATGVTVVDTFDALCTYVPGSASLLVNGGPASFTSVGWDDGTKKLTLGLPSLAPTDTWVVTYSATVGTVTGSPLVNTAAISEAQTDLDPSSNAASVSVPTANNADVYVLKSGTASPSPATPGGQIVYTLSYGNDGTDAASSVTLTDALPADTTLVSGSITGGGTESGGVITWNPGSLASRATGSVGFAVQIAATLAAGVTKIDNTATIATTTTEPNTGNNSASASTPVTAQPDLVVAKTDGATQVLAGDSLAYTITYQNVGNRAATGVTIVDTLLNGLVYVSSSPSGAYDSGAGTVTWSIGSLPVDGPHTITLNATVRSDALPASVAANRVAISDDGANGTDPNPGDNSATDSDLVVAPYVVLEKHSSSPAYDGQPVTYTIDWRNAGAVTANGVVITDDLPAGTSDPTDITGGGAFSTGPRRITWTLGPQAAGASGTVSFTLIPSPGAGGALQSSPTLSTETGTGSVTVVSSATTPPTGTRPWCELGACASFKLRYGGTDGTPQTGWNDNPRLTAFDDTGWTAPIAASTAESLYWTDPGSLSAEWVAPDADGHAEGNFTFFRQAFCLPLNATGVDGTLQLAGDDVSDIYLNGVLLGQKVGAGAAASFGCAGGIQSGINFLAVQLLNNRHGGHAALGGEDHIGLLFNLGASYTGLRPFASGPSSALAGQSVTITADEMALGGRKPYTYRFDFGDGTVVDYQASASYAHTYASPGVYTAVVTARAGYGCTGTDQVVLAVLPATGNLLANPATVAYTDANAKAFTGTSGAGVELGRAADLSVAKTVTSGGTVPGQGVTYQVVVTNNGPDAVTGATVTDTMPAALTGVTWTCAATGGGSCAHASGSGDVGETVDLPSGATATYAVTGTILTTATGTLANTATVAPPAGVTDLVAGNDASTVTRDLTPTASLSVTKTSSPKPGQPGQALTYTITVQNAGPSVAVDASVVDTFPSLVGGVAWTCSASAGSSCTASGVGGIGDTVTLASGGTLTYTGVGTLDAAAAGTVENTVTVSPGAGTTDGDLSNNSATDGNTPLVTVLTGVVRSGSGSGPVVAGATVTITDAAGNSYTTTTNASGQYTFTGSAGSPLAIGSATVVVSMAGYPAVTVTPTLAVGSNAQDLVLAGADFAVTKSGVVDSPCGTGCRAAYTIDLQNVGTVTGTTVVVKDVLPPEVEWFDQTIPGLSYDAPSRTVTWTVSGLAGGGAASVSFSVNVVTVASINNCASVDAATTPPDTNVANDTGCQYLGPTHVGLLDFRVTPGRSGVLVEWETAIETGTAGFHLYRWDARRRAFDPVAVPLLPGLLGGAEGASYSFLDEDVASEDPVSYLLVEQEMRGHRLPYGPFSFAAGRRGDPSVPAASAELRPGEWPNAPAAPVESDFSRRPPDVDAVFVRKARTDVEAEAARAARVEEASDAVELPSSLVTDSLALAAKRTPVVRIGVRADGLYFLRLADLGTMLGLSQGETTALLAARRASLTTGGLPVAWRAAADRSGLYFYGQKSRSQYTDENVYWLSSEGGEVMAASGTSGPSVPAPSGQWYLETAHAEKDAIGAIAVPEPEPDFWFWDALNALDPPKGASYPIQLDQLAAVGTSGARAELRAHLWGATSTPAPFDHHVTAGINGVAVGEGTWDGRSLRHDVTASFGPALLREGQNSIELAALLDPGVPNGTVVVDSFDLTYPRLYRARSGSLLCTGGANPVVSVDGFAGASILVLDVSDPRRPLVRASTRYRSASSSVGVSFYPASGRTPYLVADTAAALAPASLRASLRPSRLLSTANRADWLLLTAAALQAPAERLAARRRAQGLEAMVATVDEVMEAFNGGVFDPRAIRDFVSYARKSWARPPRYLVLAGDGTYDYRDVLGKGGNLVPPMMTATPFGIGASDTAYADPDGDGVPEIAVGRLPVLSAAELDAVVDKIVLYEDGSRSSADSRVLLVADLPDSGGRFTDGCEDVASAVPKELPLVERSYRSLLPAAQVRAQLLAGLAAGAGFVNYAGHATPQQLAVGGFLKASDVPGLGNAGRLPVLTAVTCFISAFQSPYADSLGEALVLQPGSGAVAVLSSSALSMDFQSRGISLDFQGTLWGKTAAGATIGDAFSAALARFVWNGGAPWMARTYVLLGDPATRTRVGAR